MKHTIPPFESIPPEIRQAYSNGVGPSWAPALLRRTLTRLSRVFFDEADWTHHDWGYYWGCPSRAECDRRFLSAMLRDASKLDSTFKIFLATLLAWLFWLSVRVGGWLSYNKNRRRDG